MEQTALRNGSFWDRHQRVAVFRAFLFVVVVTFLCFVPALHNSLLDWDDDGYIVNNVQIRSLTVDTVVWAFTEYYLEYWAPLTWISFAVDYAFWGLNPVGYHLTNIILHAINAGLFFLLCMGLLRKYIAVNVLTDRMPGALSGDRVIYCSLLAAIIFSLHPLRVESVAWATERKDVLSLFFGIPAFLLYLKHTQYMDVRSGRISPYLSFFTSPYYWLMVACYCLSLFSKPLLVTLPLVLVLMDWFPLKRFLYKKTHEILFEKIPLTIISAIVSIITMEANAIGIQSLEHTNLASRVLNALKSTMAYLRLTVWPFDLSPFYLHPLNIAKIGIEYIAPAVLFIIVTIGCALLFRRRPLFLAVWLAYLITLLPVLGFIDAGPQAMAARFTYLSGLPVALLLALGIDSVVARYKHMRSVFIGMMSAVVCMILIMCYTTVQHIAYWKDDVSLWTRVIDLQPHSIGRVYFQRAHVYAIRGEFQNALNDMDKAISIAAGKNYRDIHEIYMKRGWIRERSGDIHGAITDYSSAISKALSVNSFHVSYYYTLRGSAYRKQGRDDLANEDLKRAAIADEKVGTHK